MLQHSLNTVGNGDEIIVDSLLSFPHLMSIIGALQFPWSETYFSSHLRIFLFSSLALQLNPYAIRKH